MSFHKVETKSMYKWQVAPAYTHPHRSDHYNAEFDCLIGLGQQLPWYPDEVRRVSLPDGRSTYIPVGPIMLKHFVYRSWEEYMRGRGALKADASNIKNKWAADPRERWLNGTKPMTFDPSAKFTARMAERLRERFANRALPNIPHIPNYQARPNS